MCNNNFIYVSNNIIIIKCSPSSWHVPAARRRLLISRSNSLVVPKVMIRSFVRAKQPLSKWARGACRMAHTYEFDRDTSVELVEKPKKIAFRHSKGKASIIPLVLLRSSQPLSDGWSTVFKAPMSFQKTLPPKFLMCKTCNKRSIFWNF